MHFDEDEPILNIQGDEPMINIEDIKSLNKKMIEHEANMGTLASEVNQDSYYDNPNVVKVKTSDLLDFQNFPMAINFQRKISIVSFYWSIFYHIWYLFIK